MILAVFVFVIYCQIFVVTYSRKQKHHQHSLQLQHSDPQQTFVSQSRLAFNNA